MPCVCKKEKCFKNEAYLNSNNTKIKIMSHRNIPSRMPHFINP